METIQYAISIFIAFLFYYLIMKIWMRIASRIGEILHIGETIVKLFGIIKDPEE